MQHLNVILGIMTTILTSILIFIVERFKTASDAAVKVSAEEGAKAAIKQLQWPAELTRELQKTRGVERQQLRFKSYGLLWKELRPLAIFDDKHLDRKAVCDLSSKLSDWYFSECGGLFLTPEAREFYFALQQLLQATSTSPSNWSVGRYEGRHINVLRNMLTSRGLDKAVKVLDYFKEGKFDNWLVEASGHGEDWREGIKQVSADWGDLSDEERFAILQQVGSILRTSLVNDMESRMR